MKLIRMTLAILAITALAGFGGCTSDPKTGAVLDNAAAQRAVYDAFGKYKVALIAADAYVNLPLCDKSKPPCATLSVVRVIQKAQPAVRATLDAAETTVRTPGFGNDVYTSAATGALASVTAFQTITNSLK